MFLLNMDTDTKKPMYTHVRMHTQTCIAYLDIFEINGRKKSWW